MLVSIGRRPNTDGLGLDKAGLKTNAREIVFFGADKGPEECVRSDGGAPEREEEPPAPLPVADRALDRTVHFTNLGKVFWPEAGYTKGDLVDYYRAAAPWILPYLRDRCLVLTRYPDGIHGKNFFQKDAPDWTPEWVRTVRVWSEGSERELDYFAVEDVESTVARLRSNGVIFEEYEPPPGASATDGIMDFGGVKAAWFKDSEGNILCLDDGPIGT